MPEDVLTSRSRPVVVIDYQARWPDEFAKIRAKIGPQIGGAALFIDHVGSTAVPGLGAKDIIDIQITIADLDRADTLVGRLRAQGFRQRGSFRYDFFFGMQETDPELRKLYFREPEGERRIHLHIRERGRFNQRYALLFRDYLRVASETRYAYEEFKRRSAQLFPENIEAYLHLKEPVLHLIYHAASQWAVQTNWSPDRRVD